MDPYGFWVLTLGFSKSIAIVLGFNFFATLLIDSTGDYGIFLGSSLIFGIILGASLSRAVGLYWGFKKIKNYLDSITVSFAGGYKVLGGALVYNYYNYPLSDKKLVGIQIFDSSTCLFRETAPIDGGLYIPLKKQLSKLLKSCGKNILKLKKKLKNIKIKVKRR